MTVGQFIIFATSLILLFISTTVLFTKPSHEKIKTPKLISKYFLLAIALLLFAFCLATMLEVTQFGYRWILSLSLFSFSLIIISIRNIVKPEGGNIYMLLLLFLLFFTFIYLIFPPSLGNDTWRDIIYASEITNDGYISQEHLAYPVLIPSILYAVISYVLGTNLIWASVIIGFAYLFLITLLPYLVYSKVFGINEGTLLSSVFTLTNCLIVLWVPGFIPQAYSISMALCIFLLVLKAIEQNCIKREIMILIILLSISTVFGHSGVALCFIAFLSIGWIISAFIKESVTRRLLAKTLSVVGIITLAYIGLTTILEVVVARACSFLNVISDLMIGSSRTIPAPAAQLSWYSLMASYASLYVIPVLAVVTWLEYDRYVKKLRNKIILETMFVGSAIFLVFAFIGNIFATYLALDRYLGVLSYIMLQILAGFGALILFKRGLAGKCLVLFILLLVSLGFTFGGHFTPDYSPFGHSGYALVANPTYGEQKVIQTLSRIICEGHVLVDWRMGLPLEASVNISTPINSLKLSYIGYYGLRVSIEDTLQHINQGGIFIYREAAFKQMNLRTGNYTLEELLGTLEDGCNKVYSSTNGIEVFTRAGS